MYCSKSEWFKTKLLFKSDLENPILLSKDGRDTENFILLRRFCARAKKSSTRCLSDVSAGCGDRSQLALWRVGLNLDTRFRLKFGTCRPDPVGSGRFRERGGGPSTLCCRPAASRRRQAGLRPGFCPPGQD